MNPSPVALVRSLAAPEDPRLPELRRLNPSFVQAEAAVRASQDDPDGRQDRLRGRLKAQREKEKAEESMRQAEAAAAAASKPGR